MTRVGPVSEEQHPLESGAQRSSGSSPTYVLVVGVVLIGLLIVGLMLETVLGGGHAYDTTWPSYPNLAVNPDSSLRGTIAYISEPSAPRFVETDGPETMVKYSCAQIVRASGAGLRKVFCWPMIDRELASIDWLADGHLRVTGFDDSADGTAPIPVWGKMIDIGSGEVAEVAPGDLMEHAFPQPPPTTNSSGGTLVVSNGLGSATVSLEEPSGSREVFTLEDGIPGFAIEGEPQWSPDERWFVTFDGRRLLTTTVADPVVTRVLATGVSGAIGLWGAATFAMTDREF